METCLLAISEGKSGFEPLGAQKKDATRVSDAHGHNLHYEKFADGSVKCIEEELPFDLPDGWAWSRLTTLLDLFITGPFGSSLHKSDYVENGISLINPMNIVDGEIVPIDKMQVSNETVERLATFKVTPNGIIIARQGDMGRCAVVHHTQAGWLCGTGSFVLRLSTFLWPESILPYAYDRPTPLPIFLVTPLAIQCSTSIRQS